MLRKMEKLREQGNTSEVEESNLFQCERGMSRVTGLVDKGRVRLKNNQSDQLIGNLIMEQNICNNETVRKIEKKNGLSTIEHTDKSSAFYNKRSKQDVGNMEEKRLGMFDGHQISVQPCGSNWRVGEIPSIYAQGNTLYASGNAICDLDSTEDIRKDNINNNRQSEKQEPSADSKLCRPHFISNEGTKNISAKIDRINNGRKSIKDQKRGKFGWQAQVFHSIIQTRRTESIANKQKNEQSREGNGLYKRNDSNEEVFDRTILVDDIIVEQQAKNDRQEKELSNNPGGRINRRMRSERDQEQHADQSDIRIIRSGNGEFQRERDTGDIGSSSSPQGFYQTIGIQLINDRNRQYNSMFLNSKSKSKISFEESDRFNFINRRGKWMDIYNKTYSWEVEQRSGRVINVFDGGGLFNKEGGIRTSSEGLVSGNNSGFIRCKEQCQTQEILYFWQGQKSRRMRYNESLLGGGVCINIPTDTNNKQSNKENIKGDSSERERKVGESEKVLEMGSKMRKRSLKVPPGRILVLEVNWDKMEQEYFDLHQKHPDYQEMQLDTQKITGMEVGEGTNAHQQPFRSI
ncbi:MAG: hypothetical protein EZS28_005294 [Streblomastix strix]|uniref:Uncharacterized protein n=1 Tax=Streblomastix strix TaxID=222440 RepID=A0A5J4WVZ6_9EUKA|nr:MAG: hypothetical protein EZS28_005294 [Streblomastix strix]